MKKILMLGGSAQQIVAIKAARRLGLYTVLCDYLPDNPGQHHADRFYLVSTIDREAVLKVARDEGVDGVIAYASDPAAPTAAYVAEELGLPGNPLTAVETLCDKALFRAFLSDHGFNVPRTRGFDSVEEAVRGLEGIDYPIIVKPADSSGSKGVTVLREGGGLDEACRFAFSWSRCHKIVVEEYVEKAHPYLVGGDVFVENGKVVQWGLLNCHRDDRVNPLVPVGKSYPLCLDGAREEIARQTLQDMVVALGYRNGPMNVELVIDRNERCWLIDVGPRNGGNMIPDLLGYIFGVDVVEMSIRAAMGLPLDFTAGEGWNYCATHNLHSVRDGRFGEVWFSEAIEPYIFRKNIYKSPGDEIRRFMNAGDAIGIVFMRFPDRETMWDILSDIQRHIVVCGID